jgi:hypothetical protein
VRKLILALMLSVLLLGFSSVAMADSIMFPYFTSNPDHVATLVNVINTADDTLNGVCGAQHLWLHYTYYFKAGTTDAIDPCDHVDFYRPTSSGDIVTFDASGTIGAGEALFEDPAHYGPSTWFDVVNGGGAGINYGYLLVDHACCDGLPDGSHNPGICTDHPETPGDLDGEAMNLDISSGAAWGYRAVKADPVAMGDFAYTCAGFGCTPAIGMTTDLLPENGFGVALNTIHPPFNAIDYYSQPQEIAIYPPDDMNTRFLVTPLMIDTDVTGGPITNMTDLFQKRVIIRLLDQNHADPAVGVWDRAESSHSRIDQVQVQCVGRINLDELVTPFAGWDAAGGWAFVGLFDPTPQSTPIVAVDETTVNADDYNAIVFKLEYGAYPGASTVNQANLVRDGRMY